MRIVIHVVYTTTTRKHNAKTVHNAQGMQADDDAKVACPKEDGSNWKPTKGKVINASDEKDWRHAPFVLLAQKVTNQTLYTGRYSGTVTGNSKRYSPTGNSVRWSNVMATLSMMVMSMALPSSASKGKGTPFLTTPLSVSTACSKFCGNVISREPSTFAGMGVATVKEMAMVLICPGSVEVQDKAMLLIDMLRIAWPCTVVAASATIRCLSFSKTEKMLFAGVAAGVPTAKTKECSPVTKVPPRESVTEVAFVSHWMIDGKLSDHNLSTEQSTWKPKGFMITIVPLSTVWLVRKRTAKRLSELGTPAYKTLVSFICITLKPTLSSPQPICSPMSASKPSMVHPR